MPLPTRTPLLAALALLPACSAYEDPGFQVIAVQETDRTEDAAVLTFTISARNRNEVPIPLREAVYTLELDGQTVFTGQRSAEATIRRFGAQTFELPAVVPAAVFDLSRLGSPGGDRPDLPYRLTGAVEYQTPGELADVLFDTGVRRPRAPIDLSGLIQVD